VGAESIEETDLVIGFDDDHVRGAVIEGHASRRRSFTFREIVALLEDVHTPETDVVRRARQAVEQAATLRDANPWRGEPIRDPLGGSWRVYFETAAEIRELSLRLVGALFGLSRARSLPPFPAQVARRWPRRRR
jgi:protein-tyrosine-phosphatase